MSTMPISDTTERTLVHPRYLCVRIFFLDQVYEGNINQFFEFCKIKNSYTLYNSRYLELKELYDLDEDKMESRKGGGSEKMANSLRGLWGSKNVYLIYEDGI